MSRTDREGGGDVAVAVTGTEAVVDIKVEAAATTREGDGVTDTGVEVKEAEARVMVGDEAVLEEVMEAGLVGDGVEQDLPTMDHPSKLLRHTTGW